jgi:nicotinamidase-related amidase
MALSALDRSSALVVIDLQNGIVGLSTRPHAPSEVVVTDAVADRDEQTHRHSVEQIFPRLGETGTTAEVLALVGSA